MKSLNEIAPEQKKSPKPYGGSTFVVVDDQLAVREALANYLSQLARAGDSGGSAGCDGFERRR